MQRANNKLRVILNGVDMLIEQWKSSREQKYSYHQLRRTSSTSDWNKEPLPEKLSNENIEANNQPTNGR
jgi:hypothetical protein